MAAVTRLSLALLLLLLPGAHAMAADSAELLRYLSALRSLDAHFEQQIIDPQGRLVERAQGQVQILRPGRFRWAYEAPYEQLIVTDGATLWVHDPDLDQVTVSELDTSVGNTPALLLSSERPLDELFYISAPETDGGLTWLMLEPRDEETSFTRIFLAFDADGALDTMEIVDGFGQTVRIRYSAIRRDAAIDPAIFRFTPPPGVDVIGEGAPAQ